MEFEEAKRIVSEIFNKRKEEIDRLNAIKSLVIEKEREEKENIIQKERRFTTQLEPQLIALLTRANKEILGGRGRVLTFGKAMLVWPGEDVGWGDTRGGSEYYTQYLGGIKIGVEPSPSGGEDGIGIYPVFERSILVVSTGGFYKRLGLGYVKLELYPCGAYYSDISLEFNDNKILENVANGLSTGIVELLRR